MLKAPLAIQDSCSTPTVSGSVSTWSCCSSRVEVSSGMPSLKFSVLRWVEQRSHERQLELRGASLLVYERHSTQVKCFVALPEAVHRVQLKGDKLLEMSVTVDHGGVGLGKSLQTSLGRW